ncbi:class I SAM-dependent methyltransferase [Thalassotalea euphylliae]|uniref:Class I SAM-dependent methyltransferase n=1 Tax=Thalassotalea euphylliae TaxID=1655234 RepID=A0A3E0TR90_9GAMM|nr:class I SAM-dependent methyltransferase [Thalassotalea euphylliae]REL27126.1 class I SAM-dependent methyltransferase [Thalassotalea euphylliae]
MKSALAYREPSSPQNWQALPMGNVVLDAINQTIAPWTAKFFGYHLLKIGALSGALDCHLSPINHQMTVAHCRTNSSVIADIDDLPFIEHSVDVCLLGHALEFSVDPHHVLREASRVLIPNGYMVITGYNPISFAGLNKLMPYRRKQMPWREQFFTPMRVKDWLELMGFEILEDTRILHSTLAGQTATNHTSKGSPNGDDKPVQQGKIKQAWQTFAQAYLPAIGSVYVIVAKKRVHPLTPIKPKWRLRPSLQPARVPSMNSNRSPRVSKK